MSLDGFSPATLQNTLNTYKKGQMDLKCFAELRKY